MGEDHEKKQEDLIPRIGTFLVLLGIFSFILFLASDWANQPDFDWLFVGLLMVAIGIGFRRRAAPHPPAGRFRTIRKIRENSKKRKEEEEKEEEKKNE